MPAPRNRRFPTDSPDPSPTTRQVVVRARRTDTLYTIDGGLPAENLTGAVLTVGQPVTAQWSPTGHMHQIISTATRSASGSPVVFVDGRSGGDSPALGWSVTPAGFGDAVADPQDRPWNTSFTDHLRGLAFHRSGKAVAFWGEGSSGAVNVYRWNTGAGFGEKYLAMNFADIELFLDTLTVYGAEHHLPRSMVGAQLLFSPNGQYLAAVGSNPGAITAQAMAIVWRFSLANGVDWLHPLMYFAGLSSAADGTGFAWSNDAEHVYYGADGNIGGGARGQAYQWHNDPDGGFVDLVGSFFNPDDATAAISCIAASPTGEWVAVGYFSANPMYIYSADGDSPAPSPDPFSTDCMAVSWHPDGTYLLNVSVEGAQIVTVDPGTGDPSGETPIDTATFSLLRGGAFSPDGSMLLLVGVNVDTTTANAALYTFAGGAATLVQVKAWTVGALPGAPSQVAWEPSA